MNVEEVVKKLEKMGSQKWIDSDRRFGIHAKKSFGVSKPEIRKLGKKIGKNHKLSLGFWDTDIHEVRVLATLVGDPEKVTEDQMEDWVGDFDSWGICDACCGSLFDKTKFAWKKPFEWSKRDEEYVKRAAFSLIAYLAVHDKKAEDKKFLEFFPLIKEASTDERNFVKKAVNWALREIGKRSKYLNKEAIKLGDTLKKMDSKSARWIASDALRELRSQAVQKRLE